MHLDVLSAAFGCLILIWWFKYLKLVPDLYIIYMYKVSETSWIISVCFYFKSIWDICFMCWTTKLASFISFNYSPQYWCSLVCGEAKNAAIDEMSDRWFKFWSYGVHKTFPIFCCGRREISWLWDSHLDVVNWQHPESVCGSTM